MPGKDTPHPTPDEPGEAGRRGRRRGPPAWFGTLSQRDFDIDFFERVLDRRPDSIEALRVLAQLVSDKKAWMRAVELDARLVRLLPEDVLARYNLACSLARVGRHEEALDALARAILLGYDDLAHMEADPDLASLRDHPDFQALLH